MSYILVFLNTFLKNCLTFQGDSGGPLMTKNSFGQFQIDGIVSFGTGCAEPDFPGLLSFFFLIIFFGKF